ncbi:UbiD family decarboxylase [Chloroflexota bacterium]
MKFDSLRDFIAEIEKIGELQKVDKADWNLEVGAITELMAEKKGPALLFDNIKDYPAGYRILTNTFTTLKRTALVHDLPAELPALDMLKAWRERLLGFQPVPPVMVKEAPVKENVFLGKDVDLHKFPTPKWHELDGGRFLGTGCTVITRDPDSSWVNLGTYRCMLQKEKNVILVKANKGKHGRFVIDKYHAKGESCPIAVVFGADPTLFAAGTDYSVSSGVSEYDFAGWIRGAPIEVVKGEATDLPIPAHAEIVIEGEIPPPPFEKRVEGPFGEWTGYFTDVTTGVHPVMKVKSVMHRNDPIILGAPPLKPPIPYDFAIPKRAVAVWNQIEHSDIPGIQGVWIMSGIMVAMITVIAIKQQYTGHAKQAAVAATACRAGSYGGRIVIVVDDDIDISNGEEVMWAVATRSRAEDIDIIRGLWTSPADPVMEQSAREANILKSSRIIIDACRPYEKLKDFPVVNKFSPEYREKTLKKWSKIFPAT